MTFGDKIATVRKAEGLTQEELAELVGVSAEDVSMWESNKLSPMPDKLTRLEEALHLNWYD